MATGADSRWLGVAGEGELRGMGVSSCAACDGHVFREKRCAVIGGGDAAMEEALLLARLCSSVTVIHRRDNFRAQKILQDQVLGHSKIHAIWDSEVQEFLGEAMGPKGPMLSALMLRNKRTGDVSTLPSDAAFVAIGHDPNTKMLRGQVRMDESTGYLQTLHPSTQTSVRGVFAAGDVADPTYR